MRQKSGARRQLFQPLLGDGLDPEFLRGGRRAQTQAEDRGDQQVFHKHVSFRWRLPDGNLPPTMTFRRGCVPMKWLPFS